MQDQDLSQMTDDQILAMLQSADDPQAQMAAEQAEPVQEPPAMETPAEQMQDVAQAATVPPAAPEQPQMVPLGALHEERQRRQQLQQLLNDPQQLAQYLGQQGMTIAPQQQEPEPELLVEDRSANEAVVQQAIAPYKAYIDQLQQQQQMAAMQRQLEEAKQAFGPDAEQYIAHFDSVMPHLRNTDPFVKAATVYGARWADPEYRKQQLEAAAKDQAAGMVQQALQSGGQSKPVTLAGVTPAASNNPKSLHDMSHAEINKLSDDDIMKLMMSAADDA